MIYNQLLQILSTHLTILENIIKANNFQDLIKFIKLMQINVAIALPRNRSVAIYDNDKQKYKTIFNYICCSYIIKFITQHKAYNLLQQLILLNPSMFLDYISANTDEVAKFFANKFENTSLETLLKEMFNTLSPETILEYDPILSRLNFSWSTNK